MVAALAARPALAGQSITGGASRHSTAPAASRRLRLCAASGGRPRAAAGRSGPDDDDDDDDAMAEPAGLARRMLSGALAAATAASVALSAMPFPARAGSGPGLLEVHFPASKDPAVLTAQKALVQAWGLVRETFVDDSMNNVDWDAALGEALAATFKGGVPEAYAAAQAMLARLDDPYTRLMPPQENASFSISSDGQLDGVGLLIAADPSSGKLVVLAPIDGGPAARAGVHGGDEVLAVGGQPVAPGADSEAVAQKLRGTAGTTVSLKLRSFGPEVPSSSGAALAPLPAVTQPNGTPGPIPGVPRAPAGAPRPAKIRTISLRRERITLSPVYSEAMLLTDGEDSLLAPPSAAAHSGAHSSPSIVGYIRLSSFSQTAAEEVQRAIVRLKAAGAEHYVLDLRNNPGGLVNAGLDVARMLLPGGARILNTVDRDGTASAVELRPGARPLVSEPMVVLVNGGSASASEILAGALQDNKRAMLMGERTFGKGRIQSVFPLEDGSALLVTVATYRTPLLHTIDKVGIQPDVACSPDAPALVGGPALVVIPDSSASAGPRDPSAPRPLPAAVAGGMVARDPCVLRAAQLADTL